ncbi:acetyl-CoA carboxylase biotin carboxyl carrier protein [Paenibacillus mucilaginosus]|uniref:Biotin carboxyl carrier protein of acetyl-CoA carboxylase n=3 Tax=Paenibacillus mucilaginosus TaxID=61624 RepID=H6NL77_9BACL|nr:acetyl-CoA carboxylase biotin carboxyl carrier protein [Paenibacillus mucilaginosus]AEI41232.1 acetyl-CoA carboxylase biotin carboxyl carrier protein subunit [Paenibacillus mucilaginosus KNP414]AFC29784.1 acetyl-CoA carboxylase biotin carboxyl carrier protein subunit [Paenibacillus mucilaginosus 3016]AFH61970.1 acetyl-CoA carboxylase [Paenibacillus mucilaginosus K02]MCG7211345.1 acetyl-CoA carboxylase biotin carboxyl carrier protein [Paenibacillus mucilaginosus]WDM30270.1 acetyl-CoA carboxy
MFKLSEIKELIKAVDASTLQELEIESEGSRLVIRKPNKTEQVVYASAPAAAPAFAPVVSAPPTAPAAVPAQAPVEGKPAAADANLHIITSPMVGTFYESPSPGAAPFVSKGSSIKEKTIVCIIEAMKLMNEIEAEVKGEIVEVLVENGQLVEYGQPLFKVKPE